MWIRYKRFNTVNETQKVWRHRFGNVQFLFPREDGLCDVKDKRYISKLLKLPDQYEVAYEKYDVHFNEDGIEIEKNPSVSIPQAQSTVSLSEAVIIQKPAGKMSIADRMAKAREARNRNRIAKGLPPLASK